MALTIREYITEDGRSPFREWLDTLDIVVRARIQARMLRLEMGNLGDHKGVGGGVWEARLMFGAGYRIYFGKDGNSIIVLLVGGEKSSQSEDISRAKRFWRDYLEAKQHGKT
ncbi:MAG: type II toxin-antitoxin system RelE/ParE family toxin [Acidobacteria bacterium]|nr:type II toxin-antitoxin system RelE/ParE family toxin [Acidobacteriota bacterium]